MMLRRAKLGVGTLAVGLALTLAPAVTASATVAKSAICKAYTSEVNKQTKGQSALTKDIESGKWSSIQKALLSTFNAEASAEKGFTAYLNGASAKVKAAANVLLGLDNKYKSIIQHATSLQQFETGIGAASQTPKVTAALNVLDNYAKTLKCGTP
jgi:hypothetical protein